MKKNDIKKEQNFFIIVYVDILHSIHITHIQHKLEILLLVWFENA